MDKDEFATLTDEAGLTEIYNDHPADNNVAECAISYETQASAGATGTSIWSSSQNENWVASTVALKGAAAAGDPEGTLTGGKLLRGGLLNRRLVS
jgi:hypothetical protein